NKYTDWKNKINKINKIKKIIPEPDSKVLPKLIPTQLETTAVKFDLITLYDAQSINKKITAKEAILNTLNELAILKSELELLHQKSFLLSDNIDTIKEYETHSQTNKKLNTQ